MIGRGISRCLAAVLTVSIAWPTSVFAQASPAGVVTTLEGNVSARRATVASPVVLKFKDDVFLQDTITTGDQSLARMLLGGKAVVTVRERSVLTITEVPGRSSIDLASGKFALAVAREKMRPGEEIQIRTPNAVAGVRGTVVITEVNRTTAQAGGAPPGVVTNFYVLRGSITAALLNQPGGPSTVGPLTSARFAGGAPPVLTPIPPEQISQITAGLQPSGKATGGVGQEDIKTQAVQTAVALLGALQGDQTAFGSGLGSDLMLGATTLSADQTVAGATNDVLDSALSSTSTNLSELVTSSEVLATCPGCVRVRGQQSTIVGTSFQSYSGSTPFDFSGSSLEVLGFETSTVQQQAFPTFVDVTGTTLTLSGPLAGLHDSSISTDGTFLSLQGSQLTNTGSQPLITLDPSSISAGGVLVGLDASAVSLHGPLLTAVGVPATGTTLSTGSDVLQMTNGSTLSVTGTTDPLITLTGAHSHVGATVVSLLGGSEIALGSSPLLAVDGGELGAQINLLRLDTSSLQSGATAPLISLTNNAVVSASFDVAGLVPGSSLSLQGPLLAVDNSQLAARELVFMQSATLTSLGTEPLISLTGNAVVNADLGAVAMLPGSTMSLQGPLLRMDQSHFTAGSQSVNSLGTFAAPTVRANIPVGAGNAAPVGLAVTPDGSRLYVANGGQDGVDNTLSVVNTATNTVVGSVDVSSTGLPVGIAFTPDGTRAYVTAAFGDMSVVDTNPASPTFNTVLTDVIGFSFARFPVVTPDGTRVYVSDQSANVVRIIRTSDNQLVGAINVGEKPFGIAIRPDGLRVYVTNRGQFGSIPGSVSVIDSNPASPTFNTVLTTIGLGLNTDPAGIAVTPNGAKAYVANDRANTVVVIDTATNTLIGSPIAVIAGPRGIAVTPDGSRVLVASRDLGGVQRSALTVIDTATDAVLATINLDQAGKAAFVAVHPDGRRVYVTEEAVANVAVLDLATGNALLAIGPTSSVTAAGPAPFIELTTSTLTADHVVLLAGTLTLSQPVLKATSSTLNIGASLVRVLAGGTLITQPDAGQGPYPLVLVSGGTLTVGSDALAGSVLDLAGRGTATASDSELDPNTGFPTGLILGTDQPVQHGGGGALVEVTNGATVEVEGPGSISFIPSTRKVGNVVTLDTALLNATAPLLKITGQSYVESYGNAIDLAFRSRVGISGTEMVRIEQSQLDIVKGHLAAVAGGSRLNVNGNLLSMVGSATNPSRLNLFDGALLFVKDLSVAHITGALVSFTGANAASNILNVTNGFAPTAFIAGVPVHVSGGSSIAIGGTPLANLGTQGTITVNGVNLPPGATGGVTGSLVVIQTGSVKIGP